MATYSRDSLLNTSIYKCIYLLDVLNTDEVMNTIIIKITYSLFFHMLVRFYFTIANR